MKLLRREKKRVPNSETHAIAKENTEFALDLYRELRQDADNLFFSPYSISTAFAMAYAGARGATAERMAAALRFPGDPDALHPAFAALQATVNRARETGNIRLLVANALWPQRRYELLPEFLALLQEYYDTEVTPLDFAGAAERACREINGWIEEKTEGKISDVIASRALTPRTRLVLTNAIYFKGNWANRFDRKLTADNWFWLGPETRVKAPMMWQEDRFRYAEDAHLQVLEMDYVGSQLSMIVLLPRDVDGLAKLEETLTANQLGKWTERLSGSDVVVFLPRFKLTWQGGLTGPLSSMGMSDAFSGAADFSGMDGRKNWLYISEAVHKALIEVNEEGSEAAAATYLQAVLLGGPRKKPEPPIFRADHPFIYLIRERSTGSVLFLGRVTNPVAEAL